MRNVIAPNTMLGYCTNVHAGTTVDAMLRNLREHALAVKARVSPDQPMGVGLWLPAGAAREAIERQRVAAIKAFLDEHGLIAMTINGFPHGDFHQKRVKHAVYEPDWTTRARLDYTRDLVSLLTAFTPTGGEAGISTLPVGWPHGDNASVTLRHAAGQLRTLACELAAAEADTGRCIHLDLEPEPGCLLQTSSDIVAFFENHLLRGGDEATIRRHLRVCHDVCHAAVMFEDQRGVLDRYRAAGIRVGKVQISSAIHAPLDQLDEPARLETLGQLGSFAEDRYLHQTMVAERGFFADLPDALDAARRDTTWCDAGWRVHFHVPIFLEQIGRLRTTSDHVRDLLGMARGGELDCRTFEVETYAWGVLPDHLKTGGLAEGIADELAWVRQVCTAR